MDNQTLHAVFMKIITANKLHKTAIESVVDDTGVHRNRMHVLMHLAGAKTFSSQKALAEHLGVTPAAVTMSLNALERDGLILRKCGEDSRFNEIIITEEGLAVVAKSRSHFSEIDQAAFCGISESELTAFTACLDKLLENLTKITEGKDEKMV